MRRRTSLQPPVCKAHADKLRCQRAKDHPDAHRAEYVDDSNAHRIRSWTDQGPLYDHTIGGAW